MKPFITEEQLLNLKYNSDNKEYYGKNLADIFLQKLREYSEVNDIKFFEFDIEEFILAVIESFFAISDSASVAVCVPTPKSPTFCVANDNLDPKSVRPFRALFL